MNLYLVNMEGVKNNISGMAHYKVLSSVFIEAEKEEDVAMELWKTEYKMTVYGHNVDSSMITAITFIRKIEK